MKQLVHNKVVNKLWLFVNLGGKSCLFMVLIGLANIYE